MNHETVLISVLYVLMLGVFCFNAHKRESIHAAERKDLLDRLMAKDLRELKQVQTIGPFTSKVVSKSANDARIAEEARKVAER
jgi:preprotein translocase subunit YajC